MAETHDNALVALAAALEEKRALRNHVT